mmetsp:Transcript_122632/g.281113  ORF Transcript_122632/g.281113 Transcript_122632/m.281113 type:complete len:366 (-) Transcript_122632:449-1546(-)
MLSRTFILASGPVRSAWKIPARSATAVSAANVSNFQASTKNLAPLVTALALAAGSISYSSAPKESDISKIKEEIVALIEEDAEKRGDGTSIGPTFIRLAWHAAGTYSKTDGTGGCAGATMRFAPEAGHGANAGLAVARYLLAPLQRRHPELSHADLWVLAGCTAVEAMGGPGVAFRAGRPDATQRTACPPEGRLPNADMGSKAATIQHIRDIFGRMGFSDREAVCLIGAHALGRCHEDRSGYWGPWTRAETTFSNEYFRLLLEEKWTLKKTHKGEKWTGPAQYEDPSGELMMLPSDMALVWDPEFRRAVEAYAADEELYFREFAAAFQKLLELGCGFDQKKGGSNGGFDIMAQLRHLQGWLSKYL